MFPFACRRVTKNVCANLDMYDLAGIPSAYSEMPNDRAYPAFPPKKCRRDILIKLPSLIKNGWMNHPLAYLNVQDIEDQICRGLIAPGLWFFRFQNHQSTKCSAAENQAGVDEDDIQDSSVESNSSNFLREIGVCLVLNIKINMKKKSTHLSSPVLPLVRFSEILYLPRLF